MSSQPPYQMPPQGYGPNQPQGGWDPRQQPGFQASAYATAGTPRTGGAGFPLFAVLTMVAGVLSLISPLGAWVTASTEAGFGSVNVNVSGASASGMESRLWDGLGTAALLISIAIVVLACLAGFLPAMKRLFWSMIPVALLGLVNLIIVFIAMAKINNTSTSGTIFGMVKLSMGWGLILLLISSIAVMALRAVHVIQTANANRGDKAQPGYGAPGGPYQGAQPQGYQGPQTQGMPSRQPQSGYDPQGGGYGGPQGGSYGPQGGYGSQGGGYGSQGGGYG